MNGLAANEDDVCAIIGGNLVACWGDGSEGQLGNGLMASSVPTFVGSPSAPLESTGIAVGLHYACALTGGGTIMCWGANAEGQLGNGTMTDAPFPVPVMGLSDAAALSAGTSQTCTIHENGTVSCWGENNYGQLGAGVTGFTSSTPVAVKGITNAVAITSGDAFNCAILHDGSLVCWGRNDSGQLGNGTTVDSDVPVPVTVTW